MAKLGVWIQAARPRTLVVGASTVFTGSAIAFCYGIFNSLVFIHCLLLGMLIQIATNLANDYFDFKNGADTSSRIGPVRVTQAGLIPEKQMKIAIGLTFAVGMIPTYYLISVGGPIIGALFALAILLGIGYTAGPFPIAYLGLGEIFTLVFWGMIPTGMTTYLHTGTFEMTPFLAGIGPGSLATAILVMNNLRDYEEDKRANKQTLVVRFGRTFGKIEYVSMIALAYATIFLLATCFNAPSRLMFAALSAPFFFPLLRGVKNARHAHDYLMLFPKTAALFTVYCLFYVWGWVL